MIGINPWLTAYIITLAGIVGAVFGSFLNCVAWRIVRKENPFRGRSHCTACGHSLGILDLFPIVSYLVLRGRCRYCKTKISPRYMITEGLMALAYAGIVWKYDISLQTVQYWILIGILLLISLIDLETYEIPNKLLIAGIVCWVLFLPFFSDTLERVKWRLFGGIAIGGGILFFSLLMDQILKKESMGGGDIKLFFVLGLYLGPILGLFHLILSCFVGIFIVAVLKKNKIPFGPAMSIAAIITFICGTDVVQWYLGLFL